MIAVASYRNGQAADLALQQRHVTQEIAKLNSTILLTLTDAETGQRGFLLTGREQYLQPWSAAVTAMPALIRQFRELTVFDADQSRRINTLEMLATEKMAELGTTISLRRANQMNEALVIVNSDRGKDLMDRIRGLCADIEQRAQAELDVFDTRSQATAAQLQRISTGGAVLLAFFLVLSTVTIFRGMKRRDELIHQAYASEKLMSTTLTGIADGVIATDAGARITFMNPVAQRLTGWTGADAIGLPINEVFSIVNEATRKKVGNPLQKAISQGVAVGLANHTNLIAKDGTEVPIDDSAAPLREENGTIIGAVIGFRDISARRRAEFQLRNSNNELQQFVDAAAHDLWSPLNSVSTLTQLLERQFQKNPTPDGEELIRHISEGMGRMRRLLEDLLAFARATHFDTNRAIPVSLDSLLLTVLENLRNEIEQNGAIVMAETLPLAPVEPSHALQLFQNLIGNAIKYRGAEDPRIQIRAVQKGQELVLSVADNGIGFEPQFAGQIFSPFKRLHGRDIPGSGIGLSTCRRIVTGYGGRIWAESEPGRGSVFYFTLPLQQEEAGFSATAHS
jgi:PAS domain S-box-containing protein